MAEAWQPGFEAIAVVRAGRGRHRRKPATVTTVAGGDDLRRAAPMQLAPLARQLDRRLAGLAATAQEVRLVATGAQAQTFGELEHAAVVKPRAGVDQRLRLGGQRRDQGRWAVAQAVGGRALGEVQVGAVFVVPEPGTLPPYKHRLRPLHAGHQALAAALVSAGRQAEIRGQVVEAGGLAPQIEQIHARSPSSGRPSNREDQSSMRPVRMRLIAISRQREASAGQSTSFFKPACSRGS